MCLLADDLAEAVHDYGAKVCVQFESRTGADPRSKAIPCPTGDWWDLQRCQLPDPEGQLPRLVPGCYPGAGERHVLVRELTIDEIEQLVRDFEFSSKIIRLAM